MPLVSVIIPSYNHEKYVSEAIESVLNQTFEDIELIIIDDASKDKSKEIIKYYEKKDSRVLAVFHNENKGIARTMNEGIERASGKFLSLFSSDDVWVEDKLKKQLEILKENENLVVWSEGLIIDNQGNFTGERVSQRHGPYKRKKSGNIFSELLKGNYICDLSAIFKRENIKNIKYDEKLKYLNDYKFMVDLAKRYEFYFIAEPLVRYRIHGKNTVLSDKIHWRKDDIMIGNYFLREYGSEISNKTKCLIFLNIGNAYSFIGEKTKAKKNYYQAIKYNPFFWIDLYALIIFLTNRSGIIYDFLNLSYKYYQKIKNRLTKNKIMII